MRKSGIVIVSVLLAGLLAACGGGGGGGGGVGGGDGVIPPRARYAYVANTGSNDVSAYQIKVATGALARIDCGAGAGCNGNDFAAGTGPASVTVDPGGAFAYVANTGSNDVSAYQITAASGALTRIDCGAGVGCNGSNFAAGTGPASVTVDPSSAFAYVANKFSNDVSAYQITAASGALTRIDCGGGAGCNGSDFVAGTGPASVTVDPSGAYAYVANKFSNDVSAYQITAASGALGIIDCGGGAGCSGSNFAAGTGPASVTVAPNGAFAYVANTGSDDVSAYQVMAASGALTLTDCIGVAGCSGSNFAAGTGPASVTTTR